MERFKFEDMFKNLFENISFFLVSWLNSRVKESIWGQNGKIEGVRTIQGQTVEIPLSKPWEIEHFSSFAPIFHLSLNKIWQAQPHNFFFEINKDSSITSQSLGS